MTEAQILIEQWRREYNQVRQHGAKNYHPPAREAILIMVTTYEVLKLLWAGTTSNAHDDVKKVTDYITLDVVQDKLAAIEKVFGMKKHLLAICRIV